MSACPSTTPDALDAVIRCQLDAGHNGCCRGGSIEGASVSWTQAPILRHGPRDPSLLNARWGGHRPKR